MTKTWVPVAAAAVALGLGAGLGTLLVDGANEPTRETPVVRFKPASDDQTPAPAPAVTPPTTFAPGFETYKAGDALPTPAAAPKAGEPVVTVPGPYGPIYPDGYDNKVGGVPSTTPRPPAPPLPRP